MQAETKAILQAVGAYVPEFIIHQAIAHPNISLVGWQSNIKTALLFADVSGFTAMSESLTQLGKEGAEELTRILNLYFTTMINLVKGYGGHIIKFGGDAMTCAFICPAEDSASLQNTILQACGCALLMQQEMKQFVAIQTKQATFALRMKIGISAGKTLLMNVGTVDKGLEYVLAGRALDQMSEAEHHANVDDIILDKQCLPHQTNLQNLGLIVDNSELDFVKVTGLKQAIVPLKTKNLRKDNLDETTAQLIIKQLVPYLPPTVYAHITQGQRQFVGEHRQIVSLFVSFSGLDYDNDPEVGQKLQHYFTTLQAIVHRYGGRLNRVITGDKGSLLHLIFGAPVTHEDNEKRAVSCALAIQQTVAKAKDLAFISHQKIGVAAGYVFAGAVGSQKRREYTVMGDVVNLSARLMQAAQTGEILLDQQTTRPLENTFICEALPPIQVKGKKDPIAIWRAKETQTEAKIWDAEQGQLRGQNTPIVGRKKELHLIEQVIKQVIAEQGQLLVINGEAGVGKSRLLNEVVKLTQPYGVFGLGGDCLSYGSQSPYLPWITILNAFFKLAPNETYQQKLNKIKQGLNKITPDLADWYPLVGQLLELAVPDNNLSSSLTLQLRKQRSFDIILNLLREQAKKVPLFLLVFEDVHWIDDISLELLHYVARNIANHRILLTVLHRPTINFNEWKRYKYYHPISLTDLSSEEALELVKYKLKMADIPFALKTKISRGEERVNPFFVEEVINTLIDGGYLAPKYQGEGYYVAKNLKQAKIPDSIQALVMSRIDNLDESSKLTIKVASVIGRTFKQTWLENIYPVDISTTKLEDNLSKLNGLDLTPLDKPEPEWEYIFKHITTQEVAYESLLYAHRRDLHQQLGYYLEQSYQDNLEEYYALLAHHYSHSDNLDKSWEYLLKAGHKARDKYANEAAINHYKQALSLPKVKSNEAYQVYETLGDIYQLIGHYERADEHYQIALEYPLNSELTINIRRKIAKTWELQGQYNEAMSHLQETLLVALEQPTKLQAASIYDEMGWIAIQRGDYTEAITLCNWGLDIINPLSNTEKNNQVKNKLLSHLGSICVRTGDYEQATMYYQKCIDMEKSLGDNYGLGRSYLNLAVVYWSQSDYKLATQYLQQSSEIFQKIGYAHGTAMGYNNLGVICYTLGDFDKAINYYEKSLAIRQEINDLRGIADIHNNLGEVYHALENYKQALLSLNKAIKLYTEIGNKPALFDTYKLLAQVELKLNNTDQALTHCHQALKIAQELGNRDYEGVGERILGQIHYATQQTEQAKKHLQNSIDILQETGNKLEVGKSYYELGLLLLNADKKEAKKTLKQAIDIFKLLGVEKELEKAQTALGNLS